MNPNTLKIAVFIYLGFAVFTACWGIFVRVAGAMASSALMNTWSALGMITSLLEPLAIFVLYLMITRKNSST